MQTYILLLTISSALAERCTHIFDGISYNRESILTINGLPTNLVPNPNSGEILFTLIDLESLQNDNEQTKMDQYILRNTEPIKISNVNGQAAAVDVKNNKVYIASDKGLNILNGTNTASFVSLKDEDIVQLFKPKHTDNLYAVLFPDNEVYIIDVDKNEKRKVETVPCAFILAVDSKDNIFYECDSKYVKVLPRDFYEPLEFAGIGKNTARAIAVDDKDRVIVAVNDGLYHIKPDNLVPTKLMNLDYVPAGVAFSGKNIYLSTNGIIYKYSSDTCDEVKE